MLGKTSNQIFEKVKINGKEYNASDFLTGAAATDYVFAVKVKNVTDTQTTAIETIQGKPVVFVPVA